MYVSEHSLEFYIFIVITFCTWELHYIFQYPCKNPGLDTCPMMASFSSSAKRAGTIPEVSMLLTSSRKPGLDDGTTNEWSNYHSTYITTEPDLVLCEVLFNAPTFLCHMTISEEEDHLCKRKNNHTCTSVLCSSQDMVHAQSHFPLTLCSHLPLTPPTWAPQTRISHSHTPLTPPIPRFVACTR